jgi:aminotransferase
MNDLIYVCAPSPLQYGVASGLTQMDRSFYEARKKQQRKSSKEKAMYLLEQTGLASVRGEAFFHNGGGKNLVRFCFAKSEQELQDACKRLE